MKTIYSKKYKHRNHRIKLNLRTVSILYTWCEKIDELSKEITLLRKYNLWKCTYIRSLSLVLQLMKTKNQKQKQKKREAGRRRHVAAAA